MCSSLKFKQRFGAKKSDRKVDIYSPFISSLDSFGIHDLVISLQRFDLSDLSSVTLCGDPDPDPPRPAPCSGGECEVTRCGQVWRDWRPLEVQQVQARQPGQGI